MPNTFLAEHANKLRKVAQRSNLIVITFDDDKNPMTWVYRWKNQTTHDTVEMILLTPDDLDRYPRWESDLKTAGFVDHDDSSQIVYLFSQLEKQMTAAIRKVVPGYNKPWNWRKRTAEHGFAITMGVINNSR